MNWFSSHRAREQADRQTLSQAGFSEPEIDRLCRLRQRYKPDEQDQITLSLDEAHLRFFRWLVREGRLTEELP